MPKRPRKHGKEPRRETPLERFLREAAGEAKIRERSNVHALAHNTLSLQAAALTQIAREGWIERLKEVGHQRAAKEVFDIIKAWGALSFVGKEREYYKGFKELFEKRAKQARAEGNSLEEKFYSLVAKLIEKRCLEGSA